MATLVGQEGTAYTDLISNYNIEDKVLYTTAGYTPASGGTADTAYARVTARNESTCEYYIVVYEDDGVGDPTLVGQSAAIDAVGDPVSANITPTITINASYTYFLGIIGHIDNPQDGRVTIKQSGTTPGNELSANTSGSFATPPSTIDPTGDAVQNYNEISVWLEGTAAAGSTMPVMRGLIGSKLISKGLIS